MLVPGIVEGGGLGLARSRRSSSDWINPIGRIQPDREDFTYSGGL